MTESSRSSNASDNGVEASGEGMDANSIIENINATVNARFTLYEPRNSPLELSNLCKSCKRIFDSECPSPATLEFEDERQDGEVFHHTLEELSAHAVRGCHLCLTVYLTIDPGVLGDFQLSLEEIREDRSFDNDLPTNMGFARVEPIARDQARLLFRWITTPLLMTTAETEHTVWKANIRNSMIPSLHNGSFNGENSMEKKELTVELLLMNPRYAVEPGVRTVSQKSTNTSSTESFETAKQWVEDCSFNHMKCSANEGAESTWKPTHLLDVSIHDSNGNPGVKLIDGEFLSPLAEYCTLSHCWGISAALNQNPIRLHKGTLSALRQGVAGTSLPRTFAEAALATAKLGYNYLWIDALCIMHDNEKEMQNELANMNRIYSEATLNLAATSSKDDNSGLFYNRNAAGLRPVVVEVTDGLGVYEGRYKILRSSTWKDLVESSPLDKRAWVLQERALCKRTLHFTRMELLWECQQMCCSEVFPKGLPMTMSALAAAQRQEDKRSTLDSIESAVAEIDGFKKRLPEKFNKRLHHQRTGNWYQLVEQYTSGKLTYATDKLPAMAGLARQYLLRNRGLRPSDYIVGMWKQYLPHSLLWNAEDGGRRPVKYRAPSWSWASVEGQILYPDFSSATGVGTKQTCLEVISIESKTRNDDPFSQCESAQLKVRGFLGKGTLELTQDFMGRCGFLLQGKDFTPIVFESACFDEKLQRAPISVPQTPTTDGEGNDEDKAATPIPKFETTDVYLLPVIDVHNQVSGVILSANRAKKGEFIRIGTFEISSSALVSTAIENVDEKEKDKANWDGFRAMMRGDPDMDHYEERSDHTADEHASVSDYTYTINIV